MVVKRQLFGATVSILALLVASSSFAQTSSPTSSRFMLQGPAEQLNSPAIRDALNRPCLNVEAASKPHTINPAVVDHIVSVKNNCSRLIKVKACYFQSDRCKDFDVGPYARVDTILGTMTKAPTFRYSLFQK